MYMPDRPKDSWLYSSFNNREVSWRNKKCEVFYLCNHLGRGYMIIPFLTLCYLHSILHFITFQTSHRTPQYFTMQLMISNSVNNSLFLFFFFSFVKKSLCCIKYHSNFNCLQCNRQLITSLLWIWKVLNVKQYMYSTLYACYKDLIIWVV